MVDKRKFRRRYKPVQEPDSASDLRAAEPGSETYSAPDTPTPQDTKTGTSRTSPQTRDVAGMPVVEETTIASAPVDPMPEPETEPVDTPSVPEGAPEQPVPVEPLKQTNAEPADLWYALPDVSIQARHLNRNLVVTAERKDPAHAAFDVLRTRILQALSENGWNRVAITSPTKDCGKTFLAANLAISLSRRKNCRTLLLDCDMRQPSLHHVLGVETPGAIGPMLRGESPLSQHILRLGENDFDAGDNLGFCLNSSVEPYASEILQSHEAARTLDEIEETLEPDVMLFDLPPALYFDDVLAMRPIFDAVLLVVGGGITTDKEIKEVERRIGEDTPLLGMVLNKAESSEIERYGY